MVLPQINKISFDNLSFSFEGQDALLKQINFEFPINQVCWIRAESGMGRSTVLQLLAGLQNPSQGFYRINNEAVSEMSFEEFIPYRLVIGYGFDFGGLIANRTLTENLILPVVYHKLMEPAQAIDLAHHYLNELGGYKHRDMRPAFVPGGLRKLVCLIRAIIHEPQILLLDDPTVGVGNETFFKYFEMIQNFRAKNKINHVFICSYDEKIMKQINPTEIFITEKTLRKSLGEAA